MATWCKVRTCCKNNDFATCAQCKDHEDPDTCKKFNNFFSRMIGFFLRSDRQACVLRVREIRPEEYAKEMAANCRQTMPR